MKDIIFVKENGVATIKLNRPGHANAFSMEMIKSWISILEEVRDSNDIKVLVLTGVGKAFCAGGDIKIGRASCRERVEVSAVERAVQTETEWQGGGRHGVRMT